MLGLYLHIPFCHARCGYCDFVTFTGKEDRINTYVADVVREMALYAPRVTGDVSTVFFGGGTPSVLEASHLKSIFDGMHRHFTIAPSAEITLEANPESVTPEKACAWREVGINRLSLGLQSFDDTLLKAMGRLHTAEEFRQAYQTVRAAGFDNVSIDLIYGFPNQTLDGWKDTLRQAIELHPEHLSLYALKVEEHTPFFKEGATVDEDLQASMYAAAREFLPAQGFEQYEISNFARPGKGCAHNLIYWRQQDYLGLGVGAVGCVGDVRWENEKNLVSYHDALAQGQLPRLTEEELDPETRQFEHLMLGLRLREGIVWPEDNHEWLARRDHLATQGQLEQVHPGRWRISDAYVPLTNQILLPFL